MDGCVLESKKTLTNRGLTGCNGKIFKDTHHETHLPAICRAPQAHSWFPRPFTYPRRSRRAERSARQGTPSPRCLISDSLRTTALPKGFGFRRQHRLLKPAEFERVFAARQVLRGALFALHYCGNDLCFARLGMVIPKKQAPIAVLRNAIKRQAREVFRAHSAALSARDLILRLVRLDAERSKSAWRSEITQLLERLEQT